MLVFGGLFGLRWFCVAGAVVVYVWVGLVGCLCGGFGGFCTVLFELWLFVFSGLRFWLVVLWWLLIWLVCGFSGCYCFAGGVFGFRWLCWLDVALRRIAGLLVTGGCEFCWWLVSDFGLWARVLFAVRVLPCEHLCFGLVFVGAVL